MDDLISLGKALADSTRLRILAVLRQEDLCVCEIGDALEITQSTLSTHLQIIRQAGLVKTRKNKKWIYYTIDPAKSAVLDAVFGYAETTFDADPCPKRDRERVERRLRLRVDNCCVVSSALSEIPITESELCSKNGPVLR